MRPLGDQQRSDLILEMIEENLFTFLEFMETKLDTSNEFLQQIIVLESRLDAQTFTKLLIRVCANYQCNELQLTKDMATQVLNALVGQTQDRDAAMGLLRLMLLNDIPLNHVDVGLLLKFQEMYEIQVRSVFKSMQGPKMQIRESLPPSLFCFSPPLLSSLKSLGANLHSQVPVQWLPHFISVIAYSFTEDAVQYLEFVRTFKHGVAELYDTLKMLEFPNLLQAMCEITRQMHPRYFKQLLSQTRVLQNAFEMVRKRSVVQFDEQVIQVLILDDKDAMQTISSRPTVAVFQAQSQMNKIVAQLEKLNSLADLDYEDLLRAQTPEEKEVFILQGITSILPIQHVCFNSLMATQFCGKHFFSLETGQGKTAICLALASLAARDGKAVIITNSLQELTFRDFKQANLFAQELGVTVRLVDDEVNFNGWVNGIIFCTGTALASTLSKIQFLESTKTMLIIDEFDSLLFNGSPQSDVLINSICQVQNVYAFTGSLLQDHHKKFLRRFLDAEFLDFNVNLFNRLPPIQNEVKVHQTLKDYRDELCNLAASKLSGCPVIIICGDQHERLSADLKRRGLAVMNLHPADLITVESSLRIFNQKQGENYAVCLINDRQGRGLDFKSSADIEEAGGVLVILAILPQNILQYRQYIGRTGRIGNKGQYSVILHDKDSKGFIGSIYLQKQLEELRNKDLLLFNRYNQESQKGLLQIPQNRSLEGPQEPDQQLRFIELHSERSLQPEFQLIEETKGNEASATVSELNSPSVHPSTIEQVCVGVGSGGAPVSIQATKQPGQGSDQQNPQINHHSATELLRRAEIDEGYFEAYGRLEIHHEMLNDKVRVSRYKEAIDKVCKGMRVIDVGAGTGVLSCLAAKAGAKSVAALEYSSIAQHALKVVKENGHEDIVEVIQIRAEDYQNDLIKADVILSEWMGYLLIYERMLQSVLMVRDNCMAPGGQMIPKSASIFLAGISRPTLTEGVNLASIKLGNHKQAETTDCALEWVCTSSEEVFSIDLLKDNLQENMFAAPFRVRVLFDSVINALVLWWDVDLAEGVVLSTSPFEEMTHWKQTIVSFRKSILMREGEHLVGEIEVSPQKQNYRGLKINLTLLDADGKPSMKQTYQLNAF